MATLSAHPAHPTQLEPHELADLISTFQSATAQLESTHHALRSHVAKLELELKETKGQLRRAQELASLGEMAAGIAHEIRNPLGSIRLFAEILKNDLREQPESSQVAGKIARSVDHLDAVVGDVLAFSREVAPRVQPTAVDQLIHDAATSCVHLACSETELLLPDPASLDPDVVYADHTLMTQALTNVLRNACQAVSATGRPGSVSVSVGHRRVLHHDGRRVPMHDIRVADTANGIPRDARDRVFNPFFTTREAGTGLGLAIVHRIVDAHGGRIIIDSSTPEESHAPGTAVHLLLPAHPNTEPAAFTDGDSA